MQQRHFVFRILLPYQVHDAGVIFAGREMGYVCVVAGDCIAEQALTNYSMGQMLVC